MVRGEELLAANFPLIHAVGRAAAEEPRIVDFSWGREDAPKVALIGKGVTFDTGGLDIKPASGMELMKKDMGGAATALTLAQLVMEEGLDLRLRVVIPIVENAISAPAMRPGDVLKSRKGLAVEVGNTDAEGRLILADALALADEDAPELMFDFATLTGAARVALGPDLPPFYTDDDALAASIAAEARARPRSGMADAALAPLRCDDRGYGRRHLEFGLGRRHGGLDHRGAVPSPVRRQGESMGAFRRLRLEPEAARPRARGRRDPGGAGAVRAVEPSATRGGERNVGFNSAPESRLHVTSLAADKLMTSPAAKRVRKRRAVLRAAGLRPISDLAARYAPAGDSPKRRAVRAGSLRLPISQIRILLEFLDAGAADMSED